MNKPNFFIVGAPRCGTTSMYEYLKAHPDIFMPGLKEPTYFCKDFDMPWHITEKQYLSLFKKVKNEKRIGEGTVFYLYSKVAAQEIKKYCPDALIIIMLRNPIDMIYSQHSLYVASRYENIVNFIEAIDAEKERKTGLRLPKIKYPPELFYYRELGRYYNQVKRYIDVFGKDKVHIILFDDFKKNTSQIYSKTLVFLDVDNNFQTEFIATNANVSYRNKSIFDLVTFLPPFYRWQLLKMRQNPLMSKIVKLVLQLNTKSVQRPALDSETKQILINEFREDIDKLGKLISRDLSRWTSMS